MEFAEQCEYAAQLGYDGLELAPFTLTPSAKRLAAVDRRRIRSSAESAGLAIVGLHWLLVSPAGLSITSEDADVRRRTLQALLDLVGLCADLGGHVLVHGSPKQREIAPNQAAQEAWKHCLEIFHEVARRAETEGVTYCLEPLPRLETNFINQMAEAVQMVKAVGSSAFKTMFDAKATFSTEEETPEELLQRLLPTGLIGHVHLNTTGGRAPGQDATPFAPIIRTLFEHKYSGWISVEPFKFIPSPQATAAAAVGYLRGLCEAYQPE